MVVAKLLFEHFPSDLPNSDQLKTLIKVRRGIAESEFVAMSIY
jgi:hypothetical protein